MTIHATNSPFNINVTVYFSEDMTIDGNLLNPNSYVFNYGAYTTAVELDGGRKDRVILTVERLYGRTSFVLTVSTNLRDAVGNYLDPQYNMATVFLSTAYTDNGAMNISGLTGTLRTNNEVRRIFEDHSNWYIGTAGGLDVVSKDRLENVGFVLDAYGYNAVTASDDAIYFGSNYDGYGVMQLSISALSGNSTESVSSIYNAVSVPSIVSNEINDLWYGTDAGSEFIAAATKSGASVVWDGYRSVKYRDGYDIGGICTDTGGRKMYLINKDLNVIDVFYNIRNDLADRTTPDVSYVVSSIINQFRIASNASVMDSGSSAIYVATKDKLLRIDTDESIPGVSEDAYGISFTYGTIGSGATFEVLGGSSNEVVSVDINMQLLQLFVATTNGLTIVNIPSNTRFSYLSQQNQRLISEDVTDISFKNV